MKTSRGKTGNAEAHSRVEGVLLALSARRRQAAVKLLSEVHAVLVPTSTRVARAPSGEALTVSGAGKAGWRIGAKVIVRRSGRMDVISLSTPDVQVRPALDFNANSGEWEPSQTDVGDGAPTAKESVFQAISQVLAESKRRPVDRIWADAHSETRHLVRSTFRK